MKEGIIILPNKEEMLNRLIKANDNSHLQERFYPILLKSAGKELVAQDIVMVLTLAIYDYVEGMPTIMSNLMYMQADQFIDALVDDKKVAREAKDFFKKVIESTK